MTRIVISTLTALAVTLSATIAPAVTHTWTGATSSSMNNALNWTGGIPVSSSANLTLIFPNGASFVSPNQDIANPLVVQDLQFSQGFNFNYQLTGNDYELNNLGAAPSINVGNQSTVQIFSNVDFAAATAVSLGTQSQLALSLADFNAATTFTMADQSNLFFGDLTGGGFTVNANATSFASLINFGGTTANSITGTINLSGHGNFNLSKPANVAALSGNVIVSSESQFQPATLNVGNVNQFATGTNLSLVNAGGFQVNSSQTINNFELSTGGSASVNFGTTLTVEGAITNNGGVGAIAGFGGTVDFDGQFKTVNTTTNGPNDLLAIGTAITNGRINKIGPGRLQLTSAASTFSGQNEVNGGTLAGTSASIGNVLNNSVVDLFGFGDVFTTNQITGPGQVVISALTEYQVAQGYTGGTVLNGQLTGTTSTLLGNISGASGGLLVINQASNGAFSGTLSGSPALQTAGTGVISIGGNNPYTGGTSIVGGGLNIQSDTAIGTGSLFIFGSNSTIEATGTRTLSNPLQIASSHSYVGSGNLTFTDTTSKTINGPTITHNSTGNTTINGKFTVGTNSSIVVNSGQLTLGDPTLVGGFTAAGQIVVNGGTLTVRSLNFTTLPDVTLAGGNLDAPNGYAIPLGAALQGTGNVLGRIATANGSTIIATGAMGLGDPSHPAGVNLDGELYTNQFIVSMSDSNQAVLGSLTDLGTATQNGMLSAGNGFVLNFGRNIVGRGQIQSNNLLADAAIINGDVNGDSITNFLEFTGYVKGVGTFNNVAFSGTFSPGLSPTLMTIGNTILTPSNVLDMELGGLSRGGQYDAFDITNGSFMQLDGELQVTLINAFNPSLGDQFLLFQGLGSGAFGGTFDTFDFPALNPGLAWDTNLLYSGGILQVVTAVPEPVTLLPLALATGLFWRRRRS